MNNVTPLQIASKVHRLSFIAFGEEEKPPVPSSLPATASAAKEAPAEPSSPAPPVESKPAITEEALQQAKTQAQAQGHKEGYAAAEAKFSKDSAKREEEIKSVLETIANRIIIAYEAHNAYVASQQDLLNRIILTVARKVAGDAMKSEPYAGVETLLKSCLALIIGEPKVVVTVPKDAGGGLRQRIDGLRPLLPNFSGELIVEEDEKLSENDCKIEWRSGKGERDTAKLWNEIETIITRTSIR